MAFLSWHDQYLIGESTIDAEHKQLFGLINDFHTQWLELRNRQQAALLMNRLMQYAESHFQHEENLMAAAGYPDLTRHAETHFGLTQTLFDLYAELVECDQRLEHDLLKFLKSWLVEHIVRCDYEFRDYLRQRQLPQMEAQ